ncbi:MAG: Ig-like domain-containing protein [Gammaproteobacteria bacterium]
MKIRLLALLLLSLFQWSGPALAYSGGIAGQSTAGCTACHTGSDYSGLYSASISNPGTLAPSASASVTFSLTRNSGVGAPHAGLNVSATDGSLSAGSGTRVTTTADPYYDAVGGEITHSAAKATLSGSTSWSFTYNAPANVGTYTLRGCGNPVSAGDVNQANDGPSVCTTRNVTVNRQPLAVDDSRSVTKNTSGHVFSLMSNDTTGRTVINGPASDGGDSMTITSRTLPNNGGTATITGAGTTITYSPLAGFSGTETFTYTVTDSMGSTDTATVTVTVSNTAPTADNDGPYVATEDTVLNVAVGSGVLVGDSDANGDGITAVKLADPTKGSVTLNADGSFSYTPFLNQTGADSFTYRAFDGTAYSAAATVTLSITAVNDAPTAANDSYSTDEAVAIVRNAATGVRANDSDPETATASLTVTLVANPSNGTLTLGSDGSFTYTPNAYYNGFDSFTYRVSDGALQSSIATVTISVAAVNDPPVAVNDTYAATEDTPLVVPAGTGVLANDTDVEGNPLSAVLVTAPSKGGLTLNANGSFTYTPNLNTNGADTFQYRANDGFVNSDNIATVMIGVTAVNDAPVLSGLPDRTVEELSAMGSINAAAVTYLSDPDDSTGFTWSLGNQPAGMSIDASGVITYTPGQNVVPPDASSVQFSVTVQAADPGLATDTDVFVVTVTKKDADGDLDADYADNCVNTANSDQADNDGDGVGGGAGGTTGGDVCDSDDDNDGISDVAEIANGLDPFNAADAAADLDGDGDTNLAEFLVCVGLGDPACTDIGNSLVTNGDIEVVATGYYTPVELSATAITIEGGNVVELDVSVDNPGPFRPGVHVLTWTATHPVTAAVLDTEQQTVTVIPTVSLGGTVYSGEGRTANLQVQLNGESPEYPVYVDYVVTGTATGGNVDHDLAAGTVKITAGTSELVPVNIVDDGMPEGDETIVVTLTGVSSSSRSAALSDATVGTVVIADRQLPPEVLLWVEQDTGAGNERRTVLYRDQNKVFVDLIAVDPNGDSLGWDWSASDPALALDDPGLVNQSPVAIDPSSLTAGTTYDLVVRVSDGNGNLVERRVALLVADTAPTLSSVDSDGDGLNDDDPLEGTVDSDGDGLLDYLDAINAPDVVPVRADGSENGMLRVVRTGAGFSIELGRFAAAAQDASLGVGAQVPSGGIVDGSGNPVPDDGYTPIGALYDVVVNGAAGGQPVVQVAYSLVQPLPPQSTWRVFINGAWFTFVVTESDTLWSAPADSGGQCPSPDAGSWQPGLVAGSACVRVTLTDGGPNDADGTVNGSVQTTGGAAIPPAQADAAAPDSEEGGTTHLVFLLLLALAGFRTRQTGK